MPCAVHIVIGSSEHQFVCTAFLFVAFIVNMKSPFCLCTHMRVIKQRLTWAYCNLFLLLLWKNLIKVTLFPLADMFPRYNCKSRVSTSVQKDYFCPRFARKRMCIETDTSSQSFSILFFFYQTCFVSVLLVSFAEETWKITYIARTFEIPSACVLKII